MSQRCSVEQEPATGRWFWYDETWDRIPTLYATRADAVAAQNHYIDTVLEGGPVQGWHPNIGDYVWYERPNIGITNQSPAQVIRTVMEADAPDWPNNDFYVRMLTGPQEPKPVHESDLAPMDPLELLALAGDWTTLVL